MVGYGSPSVTESFFDMGLRIDFAGPIHVYVTCEDQRVSSLPRRSKIRKVGVRIGNEDATRPLDSLQSLNSVCQSHYPASQGLVLGFRTASLKIEHQPPLSVQPESRVYLVS